MAANTEDRLYEPKPIGASALDRRVAHRFAAIGLLRAVATTPVETPPKGADGALTLSLIDESDFGAGANVTAPLLPGARLRVLTNSLDNIWREGRVVRCIPTKRGYRVGISYDRPMRQAA